MCIQLKRFKMVNGEPLKLRTFVDFPLYDLNVSSYVHDYEFISK